MRHRAGRTVQVAVTVVDAEGRYWWFHKGEGMLSKSYLRNGPFKSREEAEEHHNRTMLPTPGGSGLQRRKR